jgi:hypothetical protein
VDIKNVEVIVNLDLFIVPFDFIKFRLSELNRAMQYITISFLFIGLLEMRSMKAVGRWVFLHCFLPVIFVNIILRFLTII